MSGSLAGKDSAFSTLLGMTIHKAEGGESAADPVTDLVAWESRRGDRPRLAERA